MLDTVEKFTNAGPESQDRDRLAAIVDSSDDAIVSKNLNGIITSWNYGAERIFGYKAEEVIGKPITIVIPEDRRQEEPVILEKLKRGQRVDHFETLRRHKDGRLINISLTISPIKDDTGRVVGASKIARDISEQVRLRNELKAANAELFRINSDLEQFSFIASHDLQELVRNILTYIQILKEDFPLPQAAEECREGIAAACRRMQTMIKDLLVYTEIRSPKDEMAETVDMNLVVRAVKENLRDIIQKSGAEITAAELPVVRGKTSHFVSLFQNLIENAIKYRSEKPPKIDITVKENQDDIDVSVADNGIGIDSRHFTKIFLPFKRLHGRNIPGTGVGLAICRRIVEHYNGTIEVTSQPGQGSVFRFTFPKTLLVLHE